MTQSIVQFNNLLDSAGQITFGRRIPLWVNARSLAANTAETETVPTGANMVIFSGNVDYYVNSTTTATVPGDTTDGTASELNPECYIFSQDDAPATFSIIAASAGIVTASYYKV